MMLITLTFAKSNLSKQLRTRFCKTEGFTEPETRKYPNGCFQLRVMPLSIKTSA